MKRREFIAGLGTTAAGPFAARAQQGERVRRIGVLMPYNENDAVSDVLVKSEISAFVHGLSELGWTTGQNLRMDFRWSAGTVDLARKYAKELVDIQPDAIFVESAPQTAALKQLTQIIPIVFVPCVRSGRLGIGRWPVALRRQHYGLYSFARNDGRQVAGVAHADCARHQAGSGYVQS